MTLSWKIDVHRRPVFQINWLLSRRLAVDPRLEQIVTGRKPAQSKPPVRIRGHKIWRLQNENETAHMLVNVAAQRHQPRRVKNLRRDRPLIRPIAPQIEPFRR